MLSGLALVVITVLAGPISAAGVPSTVQHSHDGKATTWLPPGAFPGPPQHQHRDEHALNGQFIFRSSGDATNPTVTDRNGTPNTPADDLGFSTFGVWDDHNYRFGGFNNGPLAQYAHGVIQEGQDVLYRFRDGTGEGQWVTDADAKQMRAGVVAAFDLWEATVNGRGININGVPIVTRLGFEPVATTAAADFTVLLSNRNSWAPATKTLRFAFRRDWDFDATDGVPANRLDFFNFALHETGHALGLGHFGTDNTRNLMNAADLPRGLVGARIDAGSLDGAKDLYSIPIPEPSMMFLMGSGMIGIGALALKRRRN